MPTVPSNRVLANAPGACCFTTVKHEGEPAGHEIILGTMNTYISEPLSSQGDEPKKTNVILFLSDVFGPLYLNNKLLQDFFASHGYIVLGPDYFFGDSAANHSKKNFEEQMAWIETLRKPANDAFPAWFSAVKERYGSPATTNYFAVGYCFGGPFTMDLAATDDIAAAAFAHPAWIDESHFRKLTKPLFLSCAETDFTFTLESRRIAEDVLIEKKAVYHVQVFSGVSHGFAVRANLGDENTRWAKEQSAKGIIGWFERFTTV